MADDLEPPGERRGRAHRADAAALALLATLFTLAALLVNPIGDFPLNDDWSYGHAVRALLYTGTIQLSGWTAMTLVGQVWWGTLFCLPAGFSFTALRVSTLTAGLVAVWATYGTLRASGSGPARALLGAMILLANPIFFNLANTFMTDVPFLAAGLASVGLYVSGLKDGSKPRLAAASLLAAWASLIRQTGVLIPIAAAAAMIAKERRIVTRAWPALLLPVPAILGLVAHAVWFRSTGQFANYNSQLVDIVHLAIDDPAHLLRGFASHLASSALYLGAFLAPAWLDLYAGLQRSVRALKRARLVMAVAVSTTLALVVIAWLHADVRIPRLGNVLFDLGAGPILLRDVGELHLSHWPTAPLWVWAVINLAGAAGAGMALLALALQVVRIGGALADAAGVFLLTLFAFLVSLFALQPLLIDRYLVFLLPLLMAITLRAVPSQGKARRSDAFLRVLAAVVTGALLVFTVGATHDYLAWNRARWRGLNWLTQERGIVPDRIDGGFEFNGGSLFDPAFRVDPKKSWWGVIDDEFVVALGPIEGYSVERREPFGRWAPPGRAEVVVLRREETNLAP